MVWLGVVLWCAGGCRFLVAEWGKSGGWWLCLGRVEGWIWGPEWCRGAGVLMGLVGILTRGAGWEGIMWVGWGLVQEV